MVLSPLLSMYNISISMRTVRKVSSQVLSKAEAFMAGFSQTALIHVLVRGYIDNNYRQGQRRKNLLFPPQSHLLEIPAAGPGPGPGTVAFPHGPVTQSLALPCCHLCCLWGSTSKRFFSFSGRRSGIDSGKPHFSSFCPSFLLTAGSPR